MVNIDTVYQRVLAIANKEQRGYITPLEFNLLANQAQLDVFEQYFYDRNQTARGPGNATHFADVDSILNEQISIFEIGANTAGVLPNNLYRLGSVIAIFPSGDVEAKYVNRKDWVTMSISPLLKPTDKRPVYTRNATGIQVYGTNNALITNCFVNYISIPDKVEWGYDVVGEKALHNGSPNRTFHFQHHRSEETKLVVKILELAGIIIQDPGLIQYADGEDSKKIQQEKQ
ncbi:hypothetical protein N9987_00460 [bacterium]|nr:hypothetical protein [bacterium]